MVLTDLSVLVFDFRRYCLRFDCAFVLLFEGAVDLLHVVSALLALALELEDGGFSISSMSVLLPVWPDLVFGPGVNHVNS